MCTTNSSNTAITDRVNKSKPDWYKIRRSFITNKQIKNKLK